MKNHIEKPESVKSPRFTIIENGTEVLNTSKELESSGKIIQLQNELKPIIVLLDHKKRSSIHFKKERHQKNYRIQPGDYEKDSLTKTKIADSESE
ncbi:hypothetical protein GJU43_15045 [Flavobacterium sp. LC2016-23]|nr:hypothetical protein [Flavobacterium sp. LC2016-23]